MVGANMAGRDVAYRGSLLMNIVEVAHLDVASFGQWEDPKAEVYTALRAGRSEYRKLLFHGGRLTGAVICGPAEAVWTTNDVGMLKGLVSLRRRSLDLEGASEGEPVRHQARVHRARTRPRDCCPRPSWAGRRNHPSFPRRWPYEPDRDHDPRRREARGDADLCLRRQAPPREPLHRQVWTEPWSEKDRREYLGGIGLGAKILYDEVGPKVQWDHPDNRLIIATGPLAGLPVWGTGGLTVITRGALTGGATSTQANGFFGATSSTRATTPS